MRLIFCLLLSLVAGTAQAGWADWLNDLLGGTDPDAPSAAAPLTAETAAKGIREALAEGTRTAVNTLGQTNGFWANEQARIPLPRGVERLGETLTKLGAGDLVDEFHLTLNRAAEAAVPEAADLLADAVRQMSVADALEIVQGADDAATRYFRANAGDALYQKLHPLVVDATQRVGVTQDYKALVQKAGPLMAMAGQDVPDLDDYVTSQALDALFTEIAAEEKRIRDNPAQRTTDILREVFGSS
ncbi:MAG: DUF4197 domain-containing protein [Abyssibacter sp.]|uniref:DUF4197 domain-containing protein n=1 Tax=Abyssibacter sp. TaxID=2320200 RepID=UPI002EA46A69|nr:DUF4197 domain-containing protein [Pseudomonadota bacterium]